MSAPYIEEMHAYLTAHPGTSLTAMAAALGLDFESLCLSLNNGILKGYWKIVPQ